MEANLKAEDITQRRKPGLAGGIRAKIEEIWIHLVRLYTCNTPINRGRHLAYL